MRFFQSMHAPCYFRHIEEDGEVHFTLHVDDGIDWASNKVLGKKREDWLRKYWPELKWFWQWADVMGFDGNTNLTQRTLGFTAPKHIGTLRALDPSLQAIAHLHRSLHLLRTLARCTCTPARYRMTKVPWNTCCLSTESASASRDWVRCAT